MNSRERKQARFERRCEKRSEHKKAFATHYDSFANVANMDNLYTAFLKSRRGVSWKASVQHYEAHALSNIAETYRKLRAGESVQSGFVSFDVHERGRCRHIKSVHISERVVQKCLCDQVLVPLLSRSLIYDNGASLRGKGVHFALQRVKTHLARFYRSNGFSNNGYVLSIDFSKYFDTIRHDILLKILHQHIHDPDILALCETFVTVFGNNRSLGLGSQISQICAIAYPNRLDHYIKEKLRIQYYGRYMDDLYVIHQDKQYLCHCLDKIKSICNDLGIIINVKKTRIESLSHGFIFLQGRYSLLKTGKILCLPRQQSTRRIARKIKKMVKVGLPGKDIYESYQSWRNTFRRRFNAYYTVRRMDYLYNKTIFKGD